MKQHILGGLALALVPLNACSNPTSPTSPEVAGAAAYLKSNGFSASVGDIRDYATQSPAIIGALARCQRDAGLNQAAKSHCDYLAGHLDGLVERMKYHKGR